MQLRDTQIAVKGDTAVVTCIREVTYQMKIGSGSPRNVVPVVLKLRQSAGTWTIDSMEEKR
jgi:hypothetical protein